MVKNIILEHWHLFLYTKALRSTNAPNKCVRWTGGIRRHLQAFFWVEFSLLPNRVTSRPPASIANRWAALEVAYE